MNLHIEGGFTLPPQPWPLRICQRLAPKFMVYAGAALAVEIVLAAAALFLGPRLLHWPRTPFVLAWDGSIFAVSLYMAASVGRTILHEKIMAAHKQLAQEVSDGAMRAMFEEVIAAQMEGRKPDLPKKPVTH